MYVAEKMYIMYIVLILVYFCCCCSEVAINIIYSHQYSDQYSDQYKVTISNRYCQCRPICAIFETIALNGLSLNKKCLWCCIFTSRPTVSTSAEHHFCWASPNYHAYSGMVLCCVPRCIIKTALSPEMDGLFYIYIILYTRVVLHLYNIVYTGCTTSI